MITILPNMTVSMLAEILEANKARDVECFVRVETIRGKVVAYLVREPRIPAAEQVALMQRQGE